MKENTEQSSAIACTIYVSGLPKGIGEYEFSVFFSKVWFDELNYL